jgi:hypothetical protein
MMEELNSTPLEDIFNLEPGSTPKAVIIEPEKATTELVDPSTGEIIERKVDGPTAVELAKEERIEDLKLDGQLTTVHKAAMDAFEAQHAIAQTVDPKFSARNSEVAAQYLNIALDTIKTRGDLKYKRNKIRIATNPELAAAGKPTQNNLIIADRNDVLRSLFNQDFEKTIKGTVKDDILADKNG